MRQKDRADSETHSVGLRRRVCPYRQPARLDLIRDSTPDSAWVAPQARNVCMMYQDEKNKPTWLMHDADTKFTKQFEGIFEGDGLEVKRQTPASPNLNTNVERFIQSIQQECLDHFVVISEQHLNYLATEYVAHYHEERPHQSLGNELIGSGSGERDASTEEASGEVICRERLGGY